MHLRGTTHTNNVQKQRAGSASGTTKQQGASPKKANEPIVAPPEREETEGKSEMADWLNAGVDEIVKSQVREGAKAADGEVSEDPKDPKRSRRSRRRKKDGDQEKGEKSGPDPESQANDDDDDDDQEKVLQTPTVDVEAPPALHGELTLVPVPAN